MQPSCVNTTTKIDELNNAIQYLENLLNTGDAQKIIEEIRQFKSQNT